MNGVSLTQSLSTIGEAPVVAPEAPAETPEAATPAQGDSAGASDATPKPPARDPHLDLARKFDSVAQKESRARRAEREAHAKLQGLTERERKLAEREAELDEALGDPVGYMLKKGTDPVKVAERYAKPETPEEKRIRKLEEAEDTRQEEDTKRREAWKQDQHRQAKEAALKGFVSSITAKECPNLTTLYKASEVPALVAEVLNRPADPEDPEGPTMQQAFHETHNRNPSDSEIRECLEYEAELRATRILELYRSRAAAADAGSTATSPGSTAQTSSKNESGPNGISNKHAASSTTAAKRPLSLEEKRKQHRKELTAALEAEVDDD